MSSFTDLVETFLREEFAESPVQASALGLTAYDEKLDDLSADAFTQHEQRSAAWLTRLRALPDEGLSPADPEVSSHRTREAQLAVWNTLKLASSLMLTWGVALGVRALLPRYLGPAQYGAYSFAEAVAMTFFVFCSLGVETYVQKEIPVRPQHASEFFVN